MIEPGPEATAGVPARKPSLTRFAWLSILAAILTIALKTEAYLLTGSVGLLSDAAESLVNLVAAVIALLMLSLAARPADAGHPFGHGKAEYFASGIEGVLILGAAAGIAWTAWERLRHEVPLERLDIGMALSAVAGAINLAVALVLLKAGSRHGSIALEADARHLLSDVWTTVAVLAALGGIAVTGWPWLDPAIAFLAAVQITWSGFNLVRRSTAGLLDPAIPFGEKALIEATLARYEASGLQFHDLRTRVSGSQRFMTVHVLVPGKMSVQEGHDLVERIESDLRETVGHLTVFTHLEPLEDHASFAHETLEAERVNPGPGEVGAKSDSCSDSRRGRTRVRVYPGAGMILLILGTAASMVLPDPYADPAMGISLLGLLCFLYGSRFKRTPPA